MAVADHVGEELQEERDEQQPDVHAVHVGVGGDDDLVVAQAVEAVLNIESGLEEVKLLVLVDDLLGEAVGVERFALEREDGLSLHVARGGERAGGGIALDDENRALLGARVFVAEMQAAIAQLAIVQRRFLRAFLRDVADAGEFLPLMFVLLDLLFDDLGDRPVFVQVGVERLLQKLADEFLDRRALGTDIGRAELGLGLDSKTGSCTRDDCRIDDWRTSAASSLLKWLRTVATNASRKRRGAPPIVVYYR